MRMEIIELHPEDFAKLPPKAPKELSYRQLRMIVVGMYDVGKQLIASGESFALESCGEDFKDLARQLDGLLSTSDPKATLIIDNKDETVQREIKTILLLKEIELALGKIDESLGVTSNKNRTQVISNLKYDAEQGHILTEQIHTINSSLGLSVYASFEHTVETINKVKKLARLGEKKSQAVVKHSKKQATKKKANKKK